MTLEEAKKHIETEVSEICDKIADLYNELWNTAQIAEGGGYDYDEKDSVILREERTRHDVECDDLCKRVKELGQLTQYFCSDVVFMTVSMLQKAKAGTELDLLRQAAEQMNASEEEAEE